MNKNIKADNFSAKCKCFFPWIYCSCVYKNDMAQSALSKQKGSAANKANVESFCNGPVKTQISLRSQIPMVQTIDRTENDLYLLRTEGPGRYAYAQPMGNNYCLPEAVGYISGRNGMLPLSKEEVDIESKLRYSEDLPINSSGRKVCNDAKREAKYTKEIKPCNDISATPFDRWEFPMCDPQQNLAGFKYQFGKDTKNFQKDIYFSKYRKSL